LYDVNLMSNLSAIVTALLGVYSANEGLGLFLFLMVEEAGVPLWFIPGDALVMAAGARHLNEKRITTLEGWLHRYGPVAIVAGRRRGRQQPEGFADRNPRGDNR
jgi:membrane protein DedA with SNARE-associated domain